MQPLVTRPAYGHGGLSTVAESKLPSGSPGGKGLSLDPEIPGTSTYAKPEGDVREFDKAEEGSIYRKDGPDDRAKKQDNPEGDRRDNRWIQPRYESPGGRPPGDPTVTTYPYRDKRPNQHYASVDPEFVVALFRLKTAHTLTLPPEANVKVAVRLGEILEGLNPKTVDRARKCNVTVKRVDVPNLRWIFAVDCGNGPKAIRLKAERKGNIVAMSKLELEVTCSCPGWQWLGPEYHAKQKSYIDGKPRGTASTPNIRDPKRINRVCKHVAAVMDHIQGWAIPKKKKK